jgi:hypothetical protein
MENVCSKICSDLITRCLDANGPHGYFLAQRAMTKGSTAVPRAPLNKSQ